MFRGRRNGDIATYRAQPLPLPGDAIFEQQGIMGTPALLSGYFRFRRRPLFLFLRGVAVAAAVVLGSLSYPVPSLSLRRHSYQLQP